MSRLWISVVATLVVVACGGATQATPSARSTTPSLAAPSEVTTIDPSPAAVSMCGPAGLLGTPAPPSTGSSAAVVPPQGRIVFRRYAQDSDRAAAVFIIDVNGTHERQVTASQTNVYDHEPNWSPDGSHLVFTHNTDRETDRDARQLAMIASDGTGMVTLTPGLPASVDQVAGWDESGSLSPDGSMIAYSHSEGIWSWVVLHSDLWAMDADGQHPHAITHLPPNFGSEGGQAWSPDGRRIVFAVTNVASSMPVPGGRALFMISVDGTGLCQLTPWSLGANGTPDWSTGSDLIVFRAVADEESGKGNFFTIRPDGTGLTQVTRFVDTGISHKVGLSPDGQWIVFGKPGANGNGSIFIARIDGTNLLPVTSNLQGGSSPDWGPPD